MSKNETQTYGEENMGGDAEYEINWDEVGSLCPKGTFDFEIVDCKYQLSKSQKHMVVARFQVEGAHEEENAEAAKNKSVFENFVFVANAGFRVKGYAKAVGCDLPPLINKMTLEEWAAGQYGQKVTGVVDHQDFNGEPKATIKKFITYGQEPEAAEEEQPDEPPPPRAAANGKGIRAAVNGQKANGKANGHANGSTNGSAKAPAKKAAVSQKAQARK